MSLLRLVRDTCPMLWTPKASRSPGSQSSFLWINPYWNYIWDIKRKACMWGGIRSKHVHRTWLSILTGAVPTTEKVNLLTKLESGWPVQQRGENKVRAIYARGFLLLSWPSFSTYVFACTLFWQDNPYAVKCRLIPLFAPTWFGFQKLM